MEKHEGTTPIRKVRTFADDVKSIQGDDSSLVVHKKKTGEEHKGLFGNIFDRASGARKKESNHILNKRALLEKKLEERTAHPQANSETSKPTTGLKQPDESIVVQTDTLQDLFDIRKAEAGTPEGTIVKDKKRSWSFTEEAGKAVKKWWGRSLRSLDDGVEKSVVAVAPTINQPAHIKKKRGGGDLKKSGDSILQKLRTFAADTEIITGKPITKDEDVEKEKWKKISIPKEKLPVVQRDAPTLQNVRVSLKRPRIEKSEPQVHVREDVIAKDTDAAIAPAVKQTLPDEVFTMHRAKKAEKTDEEKARERLEQVKYKIRKKNTETPPSRDIEFTFPAFGTKKSANIRTYRSDAIEDVEKKKLSVHQIAAAEAERRERSRAPLRKSTGLTIMPLGIGIISIVLVLLTVSTLYVQFTKEPDISVSTIPSFTSTSNQISVPLTNDRIGFLSSLIEAGSAATQQDNGVVQLYPSVFVDGIETAANARTIMEIIDPHTPGSFIRTLREDMMIGVYGKYRSPFIILKAKQFDLAFAGMLEWEDSMSADLAPFFGEPVQRTLDPNARTNDQTRRARFIDNTIRNYDVRTLFNELGEERILYSFIDQETILITTTSEALITIADSL